MKTKFSSMRKVVAFVLALSMVLGMTTTVFGAQLPPSNVDGAGGTDGSTAQVSITKQLSVADGLTIPAVTFNFTATLTGVTDHTLSNPSYSAINSLNASIVYSGTETPSGNKIIKNSSNLFTGVTYPHAGEYIYTVSESDDGVTGFNYTNKTYEMRVYVKNGTSGPYVWGVTTKDNNTSTKVDPTLTTSGIGNDFLFTNTFTAITTLDVSKKVAGDYADKTKDFGYTVVFTLPSTVNSATITYGTSTAALTSGGSNTITFNLKDNESMNITGLPAGTRYTITEGAENYTPTASVIQAGGAAQTADAGNSNANYTVSVGGSTSLLAGQGTNSVDFLNTYDTISPTGLLIDNLPFILLIAFVGAALVLYVRSRKKRMVKSQ